MWLSNLQLIIRLMQPIICFIGSVRGVGICSREAPLKSGVFKLQSIQGWREKSKFLSFNFQIIKDLLFCLFVFLSHLKHPLTGMRKKSKQIVIWDYAEKDDRGHVAEKEMKAPKIILFSEEIWKSNNSFITMKYECK